MADEGGEEGRPDIEAATAPNRDRRGEPPVIEGEARRDEREPVAASESRSRDEESFETPASELKTRPGGGRAGRLAAAGLGGLAGAIVAAAVLWWMSQNADSGVAQRMAAVENSGRDLTSANASLEKRIASLEAALPKILAALQSAAALQADVAAARQDAAKALLAARAAAEAAERKPEPSGQAPSPQAPPADLADIQSRLDKLEGAAAAFDSSAADKVALEARIAKLEAALAAPKSEARVAPETVAVNSGDWAAIAIVAEAISEKLNAGAPYAREQTALARLGADPAKIAALAPFAEKGGPTAASLGAEFAEIAPAALKAGSPKAGGSVIERLTSNMSKLVKITPVGETPGDEPAALASQISAALGRGEIGAAVALWARLPEPQRQASQHWASAAQARLAADEAAEGLLSDAIAELAKHGKS
jgi:hypothetical protein